MQWRARGSRSSWVTLRRVLCRMKRARSNSSGGVPCTFAVARILLAQREHWNVVAECFCSSRCSHDMCMAVTLYLSRWQSLWWRQGRSCRIISLIRVNSTRPTATVRGASEDGPRLHRLSTLYALPASPVGMCSVICTFRVEGKVFWSTWALSADLACLHGDRPLIWSSLHTSGCTEPQLHPL